MKFAKRVCGFLFATFLASGSLVLATDIYVKNSTWVDNPVVVTNADADCSLVGGRALLEFNLEGAREAELLTRNTIKLGAKDSVARLCAVYELVLEPASGDYCLKGKDGNYYSRMVVPKTPFFWEAELCPMAWAAKDGKQLISMPLPYDPDNSDQIRQMTEKISKYEETKRQRIEEQKAIFGSLR